MQTNRQTDQERERSEYPNRTHPGAFREHPRPPESVILSQLPKESDDGNLDFDLGSFITHETLGRKWEMERYAKGGGCCTAKERKKNKYNETNIYVSILLIHLIIICLLICPSIWQFIDQPIQLSFVLSIYSFTNLVITHPIPPSPPLPPAAPRPPSTQPSVKARGDERHSELDAALLARRKMHARFAYFLYLFYSIFFSTPFISHFIVDFLVFFFVF